MNSINDTEISDNEFISSSMYDANSQKGSVDKKDHNNPKLFFPQPIDTTVAIFKSFSPEKPVSNAVVYFWESHTKNPEDKDRINATEDLIYKQFNIATCEKYEVHTGYLSRYNYLRSPHNEATEEIWREAIERGKNEQKEWLARCKPTLPGFIKKNWEECISKENNRYYDECRELISAKLKESEEFYEAYQQSINRYEEKHGTLHINGEAYILEEITWILSLSLLHIDKQIYLIHVGNDNPAVKGLFQHFPNFAKAVKWISPRFRDVSFSNVADFLMQYRTSNFAGYSFATQNPEIVSSIHTSSQNEVSTEDLSLMLRREQSKNEFLLSVIGKIPGHVYWLNRNNVYGGCNDLQARDFGLSTKEDIIGKTNHDFHPAEEANKLDKVNNEVMNSGKSFEGEELVSTASGYSSYLTKKTPLFDIYGKVIGLLGLSIDITDRKKVEALEIKNEMQEERLRAQESFQKFIFRMAHDIASPLVGLEKFAELCKNLTEEQRNMLKSITRDIKNISEALLGEYKKERQAEGSESARKVLLSLAIQEIVARKKQEFSEKDIEIRYQLDPNAKLVFINIDLDEFNRMMSNLINNSVDACNGKHGIIEISVSNKESVIEISVKDNGTGIPPKIVEKILANVQISSTKKTGHGIGMNQVRRTVILQKGSISIDSKKDIGTNITIKFPICEVPNWFVSHVSLKKNSTVVILDDEEIMHNVWREKLSDLNVEVRCFLKEKELSDFASSIAEHEKNKIFVFADYNLENGKSGLMSVIECGLGKQSIIMTKTSNDVEILDLVEHVKMKLLPKQFIKELSIEVM